MHQWQRVISTAPSEQELAARDRINKTLKDREFLNRCKRAGVDPCRRQASKYSRKRGAAWQAK